MTPPFKWETEENRFFARPDELKVYCVLDLFSQF